MSSASGPQTPIDALRGIGSSIEQLSYRAEHGVPDEASGLLGPEPRRDSVAERAAWTIANRKLEAGLLGLYPEGRTRKLAGGRSLL